MKNIFNLIALVTILLPGHIIAADSKPSLSDIIAQLKGKHCNYKAVFQADILFCEKRNDSLRLMTSKDQIACKCKGDAAKCLMLFEDEEKKALPVLLDYLKYGPSDVNTGENYVSCMTPVIKRLGKYKDQSTVVPLISYLENPKNVSMLPGEKRVIFSGAEAAFAALQEIGVSSEKAVAISEKFLFSDQSESGGVSKVQVLQTLAALGGTGKTKLIAEHINEAYAITDTPPEFESLIQSIAVLDGLLKQKPPEAGTQDLLYFYLEDFKKKSSRWENGAEHVYSSVDGIQNSIRSVKLALLSILIRCKDKRVANDLLFYIRYSPNIEEAKSLILDFGQVTKGIEKNFFDLADELKEENSEVFMLQKNSAELRRLQIIQEILESWSLQLKHSN